MVYLPEKRLPGLMKTIREYQTMRSELYTGATHVTQIQRQIASMNPLQQYGKAVQGMQPVTEQLYNATLPAAEINAATTGVQKYREAIQEAQTATHRLRNATHPVVEMQAATTGLYTAVQAIQSHRENLKVLTEYFQEQRTLQEFLNNVDTLTITGASVGVGAATLTIGELSLIDQFQLLGYAFYLSAAEIWAHEQARNLTLLLLGFAIYSLDPSEPVTITSIKNRVFNLLELALILDAFNWLRSDE